MDSNSDREICAEECNREEPTSMFHLVYASLAIAPPTGDELLTRLPSYRDKNLRLGITGLLLYRSGEYMQALEGEEATVRSLYATIGNDPRHEHVHVLVAVEIPKRQFPRWSMGFKDLDKLPEIPVAGYTPYPDLPPRDKRGSWKASIGTGMLAAFMHDY